MATWVFVVANCFALLSTSTMCLAQASDSNTVESNDAVGKINDWSVTFDYWEDDTHHVMDFVFEHDGISEWEYVIDFCWKYYGEKNLHSRRCTVEVWRALEKYAKNVVKEDILVGSKILNDVYETWSQWQNTLAKQRAFLRSQTKLCYSLKKDIGPAKEIESETKTKNLLLSAHEECENSLQYVERSFRQRERALFTWIQSRLDIPHRIDFLRRYRSAYNDGADAEIPIAADMSSAVGSRFAFDLDPGAVLTRGSFGSGWAPFDIFVHDTKHCMYISQEIVKAGFWEAIKTTRILHLLRNANIDPLREGKSIFVDVGANLGWYTLAAAAQGFDVVAIEPAEYNLELLRASIELNALEDFVQLHPVVVSDDDNATKACLRIAPYSNTDVNRGNFQTTDAAPDSCEDDDVASMTTIDRIFALNDRETALSGSVVDVQVMKLDIEGHEAKALRGARRLLRSARPPCFIILEYIPVYLKMAGEREPHKLFEELMELGYEAHHESPSGAGEKIRAVAGLKGDRDYEFRWPHGRCAGSSL